MQITSSANTPNGTYFTTDAAEPTINADGSITVLNGRGDRRGWGAPQVNSTVVLNADDFAAVFVGFSHKHGGGQFWRYYTTDGTTIRQVAWTALPDELRQQVLDAYQTTAPSWAKAPGKLKANYIKPTLKARRMYKLVQVLEDGRLVSLFDGETEYRIGVRLAEKAREDHRGGYYAHPSVEQVRRLWESGALVPDACYAEAKTLVLIACDMAGTLISYPNGKVAATYCTPVEVVDTWHYAPAAELAA